MRKKTPLDGRGRDGPSFHSGPFSSDRLLRRAVLGTVHEIAIHVDPGRRHARISHVPSRRAAESKVRNFSKRRPFDVSRILAGATLRKRASRAERRIINHPRDYSEREKNRSENGKDREEETGKGNEVADIRRLTIESSSARAIRAHSPTLPLLRHIFFPARAGPSYLESSRAIAPRVLSSRGRK